MKFCQREAKRLLTLAAPVFLTQVTHVLMSVIDTIMAGQVGTNDLAALSIASGLWYPVIFALQGILLALTSMVAYSFGKQDETAIRGHFQQACYMALVLCFIGLAVVQLTPVVISLLDTNPAVSSLAIDYIYYIQWGLPAFLVYSLYRNVAEGKAYTTPALYISLIGLAINVPANYVFIYGKLGMPALGGAGCGLASALVLWAMAAAQVIFSFKSKRINGGFLLARFARYQLAAQWQLLKIGVPISLAIFFEVTLFACIPLFIAYLGAVVVAGHQVAASVTTVLFMLPYSLSMAAAIRVGNLTGQQDYTSLRRCIHTSLLLAVCIAVLVAVFTYVFRSSISGLYTDNPEVITLASSIIILACFYQLPDSLQVTTSGILRGLKYTTPISYITFISYWLIGFALGYVLANTNLLTPAMGAKGFWLGIILGLIVAAVLLLFTLKKHLKREPYCF